MVSYRQQMEHKKGGENEISVFDHTQVGAVADRPLSGIGPNFQRQAEAAVSWKTDQF